MAGRRHEADDRNVGNIAIMLTMRKSPASNQIEATLVRLHGRLTVSETSHGGRGTARETCTRLGNRSPAPVYLLAAGPS
jgi:hypothetical protein